MSSRRLGPAGFKDQGQALPLSAETLVRARVLHEEQRLPLVVEPAVDHVDFLAYAESRRSFLAAELARHGAILFTGFAVESVADFERFIAAVSGGALEYTERSSPRSQVAGRIYTSTDFPAEQEIFLHNEQSYNLTFPRKIFFYCATPAAEGGETPIADCRRIYARIDPEVRERFARRGYLYRRNFGGGLGLSWQTAFQTSEPGEVERYCRMNGIRTRWLEDGRLRTEQVRPCVARHPETGEPTWMNHLTFFHVSTLPEAVRKALLGEMAEEDLPNHTCYGDGAEIEPEVVEHLRSLYRGETVTFSWRRGDVLMLDNMLVAHGRRPFRGPRTVVAGLADPCRWEEVRA